MRVLDDPNDIGIRFEVKHQLSKKGLGALYSDENLKKVIDHAETIIRPQRAVSSSERRMFANNLEYRLRSSEKTRVAYYVFLIEEFHIKNVKNIKT